MPSHSGAERHALANALTEAGPGAPTLCEGWTTNDLAAHLVVRESRPDTLPGMILSSLPGLGPWSERVRAGYAAGDYERLVHTFRTGPHGLSWARVPGVDSRVNLLEHFVHCEDVRRGQPGWAPRELTADLRTALWTSIGSTGRMLLRRSPVPVSISTPEGEVRKVASGRSRTADGPAGVTITGEPGEIVLYVFGRTGNANVSLDGPPESLALFQQQTLEF